MLKINYPLIHTSVTSEFDLQVSETSVVLSVTNKKSRVTDKFSLICDLDTGLFVNSSYGLDDVLQIVIQWYVGEFTKALCDTSSAAYKKAAAQSRASKALDTSNGQGDFQVDSFHSFRN